MIKFNAKDFYELSQFLSSLRGAIEAQPAGYKELISEDSKTVIEKDLDVMETICRDIGLEMSALHLRRMVAEAGVTGADFITYAALLRELENRINDEASLLSFMVIPRSKAGFYNAPDLFGTDVAAKFPSASFDIEEAGNCYATGRNTACVMHLMRVMELGLKAVAASLSIPDPDQANWQRIIDQINAQINRRKASKTPDWLAVEPFFCDVSANLFAVKVAWRNPSMHLESKYDEQEARRIYNAVEGFMQHLATRLDEAGQLTP